MDFLDDIISNFTSKDTENKSPNQSCGADDKLNNKVDKINFAELGLKLNEINNKKLNKKINTLIEHTILLTDELNSAQSEIQTLKIGLEKAQKELTNIKDIQQVNHKHAQIYDYDYGYNYNYNYDYNYNHDYNHLNHLSFQ